MSSEDRRANTRLKRGSLIVKPDKEEVRSVRGHSIPGIPMEKLQRGTVVAVVSDKLQGGTKISMTVKEGDTVLYGKYVAEEISLDEGEWLIMRESDILGIVESDPDTTRDTIDNETFDDLDQNMIIHSIKEYLISMNDQITNLTNRIKSRLDHTEQLYR